MASVGYLRDTCLIRTMNGLVFEYNIYKRHIGFDFVVNSIVPDIIARLKSTHYIPEDGVFEGFDSIFLFAFEDQLFEIDSDGSVIEIEDYLAIGSGKNEAIGSLLSSDGLDPKERIIKAIKASTVHDIYVDYPIIMTNSEDTDFEIVTKK